MPERTSVSTSKTASGWTVTLSYGEIYRKGQLQAEIEAEKAALAHREEELQETRKQKQFLEEELERMRQRKVVRMADKVQHVIKRSK